MLKIVGKREKSARQRLKPVVVSQGVSFHRFQMAVWTVVLGFVFVVAVYNTLAMPDFSAMLLGLTGISAGTYVGFKIPNPPK